MSQEVHPTHIPSCPAPFLPSPSNIVPGAEPAWHLGAVGERLKAGVRPSVPRGQGLGPFERAMPAFFEVGLACKIPGAGPGTC